MKKPFFSFVFACLAITGLCILALAGTVIQSIPEKQMSPSEVFTAWFAAAKSGKYDRAIEYLESEWSEEINKVPGGAKHICDRFTKNGSIKTIKITKEEIRGKKAILALKVYSEDGTVEDSKQLLLKEPRGWKITGKSVKF